MEDLTACQKVQIENSDVISFHSYDPPDKFIERFDKMHTYGRPLLCTEYMARISGSVVEDILPIAKENKIAAYNWGFVRGRTQTHLPWSTWQEPCETEEPPVWFHELLHSDGRPYKVEETDAIRKLTRSDN